MKIDRLLSIIVYLLNRDLVSARELADRYRVSVRTIQRDMETISLAGIPTMTVQGPRGGYGIMDTYRMDRQMVTVDDLFYIVTSLSSIGASLSNERIASTIEKMKSLLSRQDARDLDERNRRLYVDFSTLGGTERDQSAFRILEKAVEQSLLLRIRYTNSRLESTERVVEPMTVVFKWRSWYLFAWCRQKEDYRLFRLSRIRDPEILDRRFRRREKSVEDYFSETGAWTSEKPIHLTLAFQPNMRPLVEEHFGGAGMEEDEQGRLIVRVTMPEDGWVYGMILSYGSLVEVLSPQRARAKVRELAAAIREIYE